MLPVAYTVEVIVLSLYTEDGMSRLRLLDYVGMAENSYRHHDLENVVGRYGYSSDGLRAKVFDYGEEVVVAFKGTTLAGLRGGRTVEKDRELDSVLFTYCSGREGREECRKDRERRLHDSGYFSDAMRIVGDARGLHPGRKVVLIGHSLGGAIASLVAMVSGLEAVAFGSPGEAYIAGLLGYLTRKSHNNILHIGMCNDVIFSGRCGACRILGYRVQTRCHVGRTLCIRDGGHQSMIYHSLEAIREKLMGPIDVVDVDCDEDGETV
jgi:lipase ATG15